MTRIGVFTGTRAEFWLLKPLIDKISISKELELFLITGGMHYDPEFGLTINQIKKEGLIPNLEIKTYPKLDSNKEYTRLLHETIKHFNGNVNDDDLDLMIVLGDRVETFGIVSACNIRKIPVAHIHGGERSGNIDENLRHAITKLSHLHFPSTEGHAERIFNLGEKKSTIFNVGSIGFSEAVKRLNDPKFNKSPLENDYFLIVVHPEHDFESMLLNFENLLNKILEFEKTIVIIHPNSDPGGRAISEIIERYSIKHDKIVNFKSLTQNDYFRYLRHALCLIGNSSSGIIEAHALNTPVINIGSRQKNRESASSVLHCNWEVENIEKLILKLQNKEFREEQLKSKSPYAAENDTSELIYQILIKTDISKLSVEKMIRY